MLATHEISQTKREVVLCNMNGGQALHQCNEEEYTDSEKEKQDDQIESGSGSNKTEDQSQQENTESASSLQEPYMGFVDLC